MTKLKYVAFLFALACITAGQAFANGEMDLNSYIRSVQELNPALRGVLKGTLVPAPASLNYNSYSEWLDKVREQQKLKDVASAFTEKLFDWYDLEKTKGLPNEVYADADRIYINVEGPKRETIELEEAGDIEPYTTLGNEIYAEMDGTVKDVLEVMLYRWGKPYGKTEGETRPNGGVFSNRVEYFAPNAEWTPRNNNQAYPVYAYSNVSNRTNGGLLKDMDDHFLVLIYGEPTRGYELVMQYLMPHGKTATKKSFGIATMRPLPNGKTAFKMSLRYQGQGYNFPLIDGRSMFGFSESKTRAAQKEFHEMLKEYRNTYRP